MEPLTQETLDQMECRNPACDHLSCDYTLTARCHPEKGLKVVYNKDRGILSMSCGMCGKFVTDIEVSA